ncbi:MAG: MFS transporter [Bacteroidota bacterium]|nr:MFS transporter [Bacteroidota bacterium]
MLEQTVNLEAVRRTNRIAVGSLFFLHGLCFSSWGSRIPSIQQRLALSEAELGAVLFSLPVGLMLSLPLTGLLVTKLGSRKVVIFAVAMYSGGLFLIGLASTTFLLVFILFFFGLFSNMVNISVNTQAIGVEYLYKRSIMASFHGIWSLAGFIGAALGTVMIGAAIVPYQHFIFVMVVVLLALLISAPFLLMQDANNNVGQPIFAMPDKSLITLGIIAFCSMMCEGAMFDWSGVYFKKVVLAEGAWVGAGYTAFMSTMAGGRFVADYFTTRYGTIMILQVSGILTASGLVIAVIFPHMYTAIIGFLLVGAGVSSVVPMVYSAAGKSKKLSPGVGLSAVSTIGFLGFLIGPPLIGIVAGATSLRISFFIIAVMGFLITVVASSPKAWFKNLMKPLFILFGCNKEY